jgi:rod shape-determining protein MreC
MESFFKRYRNLLVLIVALLVQVIGLAVQVRKPDPTAPAIAPMAVRGGKAVSDAGGDSRSVRLIRLWAAALVTPVEGAIHGTTQGMANLWGDYLDLRHTRDQNKDLQKTVDRLRLEQASLLEDARQGQRLQALVKFQEGYIYQTVAAQVIGTSGSTQSYVLSLDKGAADGLKPDMAVITPDGIVGKVRDVFEHSAQVLMVNDQTSGAGVVLETTRVRGILRGNAAGQPQVINILADQRIQPGEHVLTAGGDQIFPRGLPVGVVEKVVRDTERGSFINVIVKPAANLEHLDEVLVITALDSKLSAQQQADVDTSEALKGAEVAAEEERKKASQEMSERLPGLTDPNAPAGANGVAAGVTPGAPGTSAVGVTPAALLPAPKPLVTKHPDRYSPGAADASSDGPAGAEAPAAPVVEKKAAPAAAKAGGAKAKSTPSMTPNKTQNKRGRAG